MGKNLDGQFSFLRLMGNFPRWAKIPMGNFPISLMGNFPISLMGKNPDGQVSSGQFSDGQNSRWAKIRWAKILLPLRLKQIGY